MLVRSTFIELSCNKSTQLERAFIGHARQSHETPKLGRLLLNTLYSDAAVYTGVRELSSVDVLWFLRSHIVHLYTLTGAEAGCERMAVRDPVRASSTVWRAGLFY